MASVGARFCFFLNGISFIPVLIGLSLIRPQTITVTKRTDNMFKSISDGLKYNIKKPILACAVLTVLAVGTFTMNNNVLFPVFADQVLHQGVNGYGFLLSAMGIGSLVGALFIAIRVHKEPNRRTMFASSLIISALLVILFFIRSYFLAVLAVAGIGFLSIIFMNTVNSTLQLNSSDEYRGRTMSVFTLSLGGTTPQLATCLLVALHSNSGRLLAS